MLLPRLATVGGQRDLELTGRRLENVVIGATHVLNLAVSLLAGLAQRRASRTLSGMARTPRIPRELTSRPFSLQEARAAGLTLDALRGRAWRRLGSELYCWEGVREDAWGQLVAWKELLPRSLFLAARLQRLLGLDLDPINPVEIVLPYTTGVRSRSGLTVRRSEIAADQVVTVRKLRATNLLWTLSDLCLRYPAVEALVALDMAIRGRLISAVALDRYAKPNKGGAGIRQLRFLTKLVAPAESPMETRLRWLLI